MQISYDVTDRDLIAFNEHFAFTSGAVNFRKVAALQAFGIGATAFFIVMIANDHALSAAAVALVVAGIVFVTWPSVHRSQIRKAIPKIIRRVHAAGARENALGRHTLEIGPDGLVERSDVKEVRQRWEGVPNVDVTPGYVFIYSSPMSAFIVPRPAIPDLAALLAVVSRHVAGEKLRRFESHGA